MADPATMAIAGAALGAATNKDDPMKGALMGAALGGGGGYLLGGAGGAAAAEAGGAGALEGAIGNALIDSSLGGAYDAAGIGLASPVSLSTPPMLASEMAPPAWYGPSMWPEFQAPNVPLSSPQFDYDAIARASMGSDIPGASAVSGSSAYNPMRINPMMAMSALNMMGQQQPQMAGGGVRRGNPQLVQQDAIQSLLAPKRVQKRQISLL